MPITVVIIPDQPEYAVGTQVAIVIYDGPGDTEANIHLKQHVISPLMATVQLESTGDGNTTLFEIPGDSELINDAVFEVRNSDDSVLFGASDIFTITAANPIEGGYNTLEDMQIARGVDNIRVWSQKDPEGSLNIAAVNKAIIRARDQINMKLRTRFTWPLVSTQGAAVPDDALSTLEQLSEPTASYEVYIGRGFQVEDDSRGNLLKRERDFAMGYYDDNGIYIPGILDRLVSGELFIDLQTLSTDQQPRAEAVGTLQASPYGYASYWPWNKY